MSKGLEALERIIGCSTIESHTKKWQQDYNTIEKELQALEIIKPLVDLTKESNHCWLWLGLNGRQITQEQYDLLKEVLKDETSNND